MQKMIHKIRSYSYQKNWMIKYPERLPELKIFGLHPKIKEEFPALVIGSEWGFFDLKN